MAADDDGRAPPAAAAPGVLCGSGGAAGAAACLSTLRDLRDDCMFVVFDGTDSEEEGLFYDASEEAEAARRRKARQAAGRAVR